MQHPAFNAQHAQMLLARGLMAPMAQRPPPGLYRPPTNGLYHGPDHGPLPPGAAAAAAAAAAATARMQVPHPGQGSVIRHLTQHLPQHIPTPQHMSQHAPHPGPHASATHQSGSQVNGVTSMSSQVRSSTSGQSSRSQDTLHRIPHLAAAAGNLPEAAEKKVDSSSTKGIFGWTQIDGVDLPFLLRDEKKYLAVRMVEMKLLSKYPSTYPEELKHRPPLMSHYITENEAKILNEINKHHCGGEYGQHQFVTQDLIVKMTDFEEFYNIVKKHFPPSVLAQLPQSNSQEKKVDGGWLQMNNTVVPYVFRGKARFVPLSVIRYAAGLLTDVQVDGENPKDDECTYLNESCKTAGVEFNFVRTTKLVMLGLVQRLCNNTVKLAELPKNDPFSQAEYHGALEEDKHDEGSSGGSMSLSTNQMPYPGLSSAGGSSRASSSGPSPPSAATGTPASQAGPTPGSGVPYWMNQHLGIYPGAPGGAFPGGPLGMRGPGRPPLAPGGIPHPSHSHATAQAAAALANHLNSASSRPSGQGAHISPPASQYQPKSTEVNNNSAFSGGQRRPSHEAMDLSRELASPREKKESSNPPTPSGTPLGRTLSSSSLPQSTTPVPRTGSAGSVNTHRSTPDGSPQTLMQQVHQVQQGLPAGVIPGMPTLHPGLTMGPDGHPVLGSLVPPGHPGWHPMMSNPAEYHKMVQIMQLQAMAQQQQHQQHQLQQQLQMLEQQHLQQQRLKQNETKSLSRSGSRAETSRSASSGATQSRSRSSTSSTTSQSSPSDQKAGGSKSTTTSSASGGSVNKSSLTQAVIQRVEFQGKTLSCIVKGERKEYYALVEALSRVYFPNCTLEDFQFALEKLLQVPLVKLTEEEERSFISFYNIPTKTLMCNKVIRLAEFQELIPQLKTMFRDKLPAGASEKLSDNAAPPRGTVLVTAHSGKDNNDGKSPGEGKDSPSSSTPGTPNVNNEALGKLSAALKAYIGKRPATSDNNDSSNELDSPGPAKQPKVSIEDAVNRLKQFQAEQKSKRKSSRPERRTGSQSPTSDTPTEYIARSPDDEEPDKSQCESPQLITIAPNEREAGNRPAGSNTPMEVDTQEVVADQNKDSKGPSESLSEANDSENTKSTALITTTESTSDESATHTSTAVIDFSKNTSDTVEDLSQISQTHKESGPAENLRVEKDINVETSTGGWANTQPETASDDLPPKTSVYTEVALDLVPEPSADKFEMEACYSALQPVEDATNTEECTENDTGTLLNMAITPTCTVEDVPLSLENKVALTLTDSKDDNIDLVASNTKDTDNISEILQDLTTIKAYENTDSDKVLVDQPVDLHSTPVAPDTTAHVSEITTHIQLPSEQEQPDKVGDSYAMDTETVSAESRLESAGTQFASATVNSDSDPPSGVNDNVSKEESDTITSMSQETDNSQSGDLENIDQLVSFSVVSDMPDLAQSGLPETTDFHVENYLQNNNTSSVPVDAPVNLAVKNDAYQTGYSQDTDLEDPLLSIEPTNQIENSSIRDSQSSYTVKDTQLIDTVTAIDMTQVKPSTNDGISNEIDNVDTAKEGQEQVMNIEPETTSQSDNTTTLNDPLDMSNSSQNHVDNPTSVSDETTEHGSKDSMSFNIDDQNQESRIVQPMCSEESIQRLEQLEPTDKDSEMTPNTPVIGLFPGLDEEEDQEEEEEHAHIDLSNPQGGFAAEPNLRDRLSLTTSKPEEEELIPHNADVADTPIFEASVIPSDSIETPYQGDDEPADLSMNDNIDNNIRTMTHGAIHPADNTLSDTKEASSFEKEDIALTEAIVYNEDTCTESNNVSDAVEAQSDEASTHVELCTSEQPPQPVETTPISDSNDTTTDNSKTIGVDVEMQDIVEYAKPIEAIDIEIPDSMMGDVLQPNDALEHIDSASKDVLQHNDALEHIDSTSNTDDSTQVVITETPAEEGNKEEVENPEVQNVEYMDVEQPVSSDDTAVEENMDTAEAESVLVPSSEFPETPDSSNQDAPAENEEAPEQEAAEPDNCIDAVVPISSNIDNAIMEPSVIVFPTSAPIPSSSFAQMTANPSSIMHVQKQDTVPDIQPEEGSASEEVENTSAEPCPLSSDTTLNLQQDNSPPDNTSQNDAPVGTDSIDFSSLGADEDMEVPDSDLESKLLESPPCAGSQETTGAGTEQVQVNYSEGTRSVPEEVQSEAVPEVNPTPGAAPEQSAEAAHVPEINTSDASVPEIEKDSNGDIITDTKEVELEACNMITVPEKSQDDKKESEIVQAKAEEQVVPSLDNSSDPQASSGEQQGETTQTEESSDTCSNNVAPTVTSSQQEAPTTDSQQHSATPTTESPIVNMDS